MRVRTDEAADALYIRLDVAGYSRLIGADE
jgi:hypothetical protein